MLFQLIGQIWHSVGGIVSYMRMLGSSLIAIGISLFVLSIRRSICWILGIQTESIEEVEPTEVSKISLTQKDLMTFLSPPSLSDKIVKQVCIYYGTQTGTAQMLAEQLHHELLIKSKDDIICSMNCLSGIEVETLVDLQKGPHPSESTFIVFILSTYIDGSPPENCAWFCKSLEEHAYDFRVSKSHFAKLKYTVFGLGNSVYDDNYNKASCDLNSNCQELGAKLFFPVGVGNENIGDSDTGGTFADFDNWKNKLITILLSESSTSKTDFLSQNLAKSSQPTKPDELVESSSEDEPDEGKENENPKVTSIKSSNSSGLVDLEELGNVVHKARSKIKEEKEDRARGILKEMVTPELRQALTKQGYKIVGSHSGVKLCRWTKAMLRGRGGCYKHSFYGIASHQCMEATPSLACANKCVFCWRHHSNPVGTEWKWKMDDAEMLIEGALNNHYKMIKEFRGVPGVSQEKLNEGLRARHCALSLVGEPIMYPEINKFVSLLHQKRISSFLVTNAQFPDAIRNLTPVTQLYVSVDASTKDSLKKIDRPLFKDFWERFLDSLKALREKGQRTVYRLTLVKAWNVEELENYANLVELGNPDFIEIKGVTYCGTSKASTLTMENVPWHEEVIEFTKKLRSFLPNYEISCEHEHSNCVLLANTKFKVNGEWNTWIDYDRFHQLVQKFYSDGSPFSAFDYMAPTPNWAVYGSNERGFDPDEVRWQRKNTKKDISGC